MHSETSKKKILRVAWPPKKTTLFHSENAKMLFHTQAFASVKNFNCLSLVWILAFSAWLFDLSQLEPVVQHDLGTVAAKKFDQKFTVFSGEVFTEKAAVHTIFRDPSAPFNVTVSRSILGNSILFHTCLYGASSEFQASVFCCI